MFLIAAAIGKPVGFPRFLFFISFHFKKEKLICLTQLVKTLIRRRVYPRGVQLNRLEWSPLNNIHHPTTASFQYLQSAVSLYI